MLEETKFRAGFVAITGRPNVGKSTLLNALLKSKVSIISTIPQTTRYLIRGVLNFEDGQIVFVDSPGIHSFRDNLSQKLNLVAKKALIDTEGILYVVDCTRSPGEEEATIMEILLDSIKNRCKENREKKVSLIMAINKMDLKGRFFNDYICMWEEKVREKKIDNPLKYYIPVSAKTGLNLDKLMAVFKEILPYHPPFYNKDMLTDFPLRFRIADIIREKLFLKLKEELPHSLAVEVREMKDKKEIFYILVYIYVNRESQKGIVIGKKGELIKKVGFLSRRELEPIVGKHIYVDLRVKVMHDWQNKERILRELGYE